jgi:signal recognition particle receptor subunit beta
MSVYKIIFTGPVGAGKTTAIASISDIEPFQTEEMATDDTKNMKANTTVAMDYGLMKLEDGERIHLYGTPGQERFDFMWDILTDGGIGLILLLNNANPAPIKDMEFYLSAFENFARETGLAIGVTRMDDSHKPNLDDYCKVLEKYNLNCPVFEVDARNAEDVIMLTTSLLYSIDPGLH